MEDQIHLITCGVLAQSKLRAATGFNNCVILKQHLVYKYTQ